jgi:photosystem II stability/assembly factor-like uncharacterized protein
LAAAKAAVAAGSQVPGVELALRRADLFVAGGPDLPFFTLLVLNPRKVFAFGAYRLAMVSEDGGKNWADCSLDIYEKFSVDLFDAKIIDGAIYLAGGAGSVLSSTNGGAFFTPLATPADVTLFGILAAPDGSLLVYGVAGACFRSSDGAKSWASVNLGVDDNILAGCVLRSGIMMLASQTGTLLASANNGASFTVVNSLPSLVVCDVIQTSRDTLVLVGTTGVAEVSTDVLNN